MIIFQLAIAAAVGVIIGLAGARVMRGHREVPRWLAMAIGSAAAIIGTAAARSIRPEPLGPVLMLGAPLFFACIAVVVMIAKLNRSPEKPGNGDRRFPIRKAE